MSTKFLLSSKYLIHYLYLEHIQNMKPFYNVYTYILLNIQIDRELFMFKTLKEFISKLYFNEILKVLILFSSCMHNKYREYLKFKL